MQRAVGPGEQVRVHLECEGGLDEVLRGQVEVVQLVHVAQEHLLAVRPVAAATAAVALVEVEEVDDAGHLLVAALAGLQVWRRALKEAAFEGFPLRQRDEKQMFP